MKPVFDKLRKAGFETPRAMANELNRRGVDMPPTSPRGNWRPWHETAVARLRRHMEGPYDPINFGCYIQPRGGQHPMFYP